MASDIRPQRRRFAARAFALLALVAVLLIAAASWLCLTESGARAGIALLHTGSRGAVHGQGVRGRLAGPLEIERMTLDVGTQRIVLENIRADWEPRALLERTLHVRSLHIGKFSVSGKAQENRKTARLPDSIGLPFQVRADRVVIDSGDIGLQDANPVRLGGLALHGDFDGQRYRLRIDWFAAGFATGGGNVSSGFGGDVTLSVIRPYAVHAELSGDGEAVVGGQTIDAIGSIRIDGSLAEMGIAVNLAVNQATLQGRATLRPFSGQILGTTNLAVQNIDLAGFGENLPRTQLDLKLGIAQNGSGELSIRNADPGLHNQKKLPLTTARILFRQRDGQLEFDSITANLGVASRGVIDGNGRYADGALRLDLALKSVDLRAIDSRLQPTQLLGRLGLHHASSRQELSADLREPLTKKRQMTLSAHAVLTKEAWVVDRADMRIGGGRIEANGRMELMGSGAFRAAGRMIRFRAKDIGDFTQFPELLLNGRFSLHGTRRPQWTADVSFNIDDSRIAGQALQGQADARLEADRIGISKLLLVAGGNRLSAQGELTRDGGQIAFALTAPQLTYLGHGFAGTLQVQGSVRGDFMRPRISATWNGSALHIADELWIDATEGKADIDADRGREWLVRAASIDMSARGIRSGPQRIASLSARLRFALQPDAPLDLVIRAQELAASERRADSIELVASGTTARHAVEAVLTEPGQQWALSAGGGLQELDRMLQWRGEIRRFDAAGRFVGRIAAPAPLLVSRQEIRLDRFQFNGSIADIVVDHFMRDASGIVTRGRVQRLRMARLLEFAGREPALTTDLEIGGEWNLTLTDAPTGSITLRRERGDIVMRGSAPVALGMDSLEANANMTGGRLTMQLRAAGRQFGRIEANGMAIVDGAGRLAPLPDAPLSGSVRIDMPSLSWVGALMSSSTLLAEGRLQSSVAIAGTISQPRLNGQISGSGLRLLFADTGVDLRQGTLDAEFQGSQLLIRRLRFGSRDGVLNASGRIDLGGQRPSAQIALTADRFTLLDRSDRRLRISGESRAGWREGRATITGAFKVDSGFLDIGSIDMPRLSDDVVIVGRSQGKAAERGLPAAIDIGIALDEGVALRGRGLNALLGGELRLASEPGEALRVRGTLHVAKGTFAAYGRELTIEKGVLRFNGPLNNPALDILAMRRGQEVEAGVAVRGTALAPRVTLVSEPPLAEAEKLSWLVLGRSLGTGGEGDLAALQSAAGALLSRGAAVGVQSRITSAFGLDELSIGTESGTIPERIVTLGKQISSKLYLSFERGLETASSVVHLRYVLTPRLSLEAEAGSRSALSLFYNFSFD